MEIRKVYDQPDKVGTWIYRGKFYEHGEEITVADINGELRAIVGDYPYPLNRFNGLWEYVPFYFTVTSQREYFNQFSAVE